MHEHYLFIYLLKSYSPVNCTGSPQGFSQVHISNKTYKTYILHKRKTYKHNPKVSPFDIALVKKWQIKLGDAGTIHRFGLAFQ